MSRNAGLTGWKRTCLWLVVYHYFDDATFGVIDWVEAHMDWVEGSNDRVAVSCFGCGGRRKRPLTVLGHACLSSVQESWQSFVQTR